MAGKPIPVSQANDMITAYYNYMTGLGVDMRSQTQSVSFTGSIVMSWLNSVMSQADELKIFMGIYLPGHLKAGRTTVILWPYKNGQPLQSGTVYSLEEDPNSGGGGSSGGSGGGGDVEPFNDGQGNP